MADIYALFLHGSNEVIIVTADSRDDAFEKIKARGWPLYSMSTAVMAVGPEEELDKGLSFFRL